MNHYLFHSLLIVSLVLVYLGARKANRQHRYRVALLCYLVLAGICMVMVLRSCHAW